MVKPRDGVFVNGVKIKFKGVNRHSFRPASGRTLSKTNSIEDVELMKEMNMNAVRMSHYPPDGHFWMSVILLVYMSWMNWPAGMDIMIHQQVQSWLRK